MLLIKHWCPICPITHWHLRYLPYINSAWDLCWYTVFAFADICAGEKNSSKSDYYRKWVMPAVCTLNFTVRIFDLPVCIMQPTAHRKHFPPNECVGFKKFRLSVCHVQHLSFGSSVFPMCRAPDDLTFCACARTSICLGIAKPRHLRVSRANRTSRSTLIPWQTRILDEVECHHNRCADIIG